MCREQRIALIEREHPRMPVTVQTEMLGLNRTSLYYQPIPISEKEVATKAVSRDPTSILRFSAYHGGFTPRNGYQPQNCAAIHARNGHCGHLSRPQPQ